MNLIDSNCTLHLSRGRWVMKNTIGKISVTKISQLSARKKQTNLCTTSKAIMSGRSSRGFSFWLFVASLAIAMMSVGVESQRTNVNKNMPSIPSAARGLSARKGGLLVVVIAFHVHIDPHG